MVLLQKRNKNNFLFFNKRDIIDNSYPYEITKRNTSPKKISKKSVESTKKTNSKRKNVKTKSRRKRYGQNKGLHKRRISSENYSSWANESKTQKSLNKLKHRIKYKNIQSIDNHKQDSNREDTVIDSTLISSYINDETISQECRNIFSIMEKWNMDLSWIEIDLSEEQYYNETNISKYPCCYNNNNVVCENNKIVELNFDECEIEGEIPEEISDFPNLTKLFLGTNRLNGTIPLSLNKLENLEYLWLYYNNLTGTIPSTIGNLPKLKSINLHGNNITGTIPEEIGNLSELETLDLHSNQLEGGIPNSFKNLSKLKRLYLNFNNLKITDVSSMPSSLEVCNFKDNAVSNTIYKEQKDSLKCSSGYLDIFSMSLQGILLIVIINIILQFKI